MKQVRPLFFAVLLGIVPIDGLADVLRLEGRVLNEAELDRTLISKPGWLRGLHVMGQELRNAAPPSILAVVPRSWAGDKVCARITSMSGHYAAVIEFDVPTALSGNQEATLAFTPGSELIRELTPADSGVSLERGICAQSPQGENQRQFIANYWNQSGTPSLSPSGKAQLVLNINVARADELLFSATLDEQPLDWNCDKLDDPEALAFNFRCVVVVPPEQLSDAEGRMMRVTYTRLYRGRESDPRQADIFIGASQ